jgi:hypothetical protein
MTKELRDEVFARSPQLLTDIQETATLGDYAAARIPGPDGKDEGHYLRPIFKRTPQGWRFLSMDDARGPLKEALAQYVQSLTTAAEKAEQPAISSRQPIFGPIVTRTLFSATKDSIKGEDLDKGEAIKLPEEVKKSSDEGQAFRWLAEHGVDLIAINEGKTGFMVSLELTVVKSELWEQAGAADVQTALDSGEVGPQLIAHGDVEGFVAYEIKPDAAFPMTFAFKSPAGGKGLLQFLGFIENKLGMRIRYKLLQGTANSLPKPQNTENFPAKMEDSKEHFSPVIERVVNDSRHNLADCAIDFETGKLFSLPEGLRAESNRTEEIRIEEALTWVQNHGVDAIGSLTSGEGIMSSCELGSEGVTQLFAEKIGNDLWDKMSEKDLSKAIFRSKWRRENERTTSLTRMLTEAPDYSSIEPATYIFETREGGKGILQIEAIDGDNLRPTGVKVRYKLLRKPVPTEATALYDFINNEGNKAVRAMQPGDVESMNNLHSKFEPQYKKLEELLKGTVAEIPFLEVKKFVDEKDKQHKQIDSREVLYLTTTFESLIHGKTPPKWGFTAEKPVEPQGPKLIYEFDSSGVPAEMTASIMDIVMKVADRRLNAGKEKLAVIRKLTDRQLEVALLRQNNADKNRAERLLSRDGKLEFRILATERNKEIVEQARKEEAKTEVFDVSGKKVAYWVPLMDPEKNNLAKDTNIIRRTRKEDEREITEVLVAMDPYNVTWAYLTQAEADTDSVGHPCISFTLNETGGILFGKLTSEHQPDPTNFSLRYQLGIMLDGKLHSAPNIMSKITNRGQISGNFTTQEVADLVDILNAGSLPVRLRLVGEPPPSAIPPTPENAGKTSTMPAEKVDTKQATEKSAAVFGPVVTRTLFSATEYSIKGEDLDKGEVIKLPEQVKKDSDNNEGHAFRWFAEHGVDLLVANQGMQSPGFVATLELATVKNELWEQAGAAEVQASLDSGEVGPQLKAMGEGEGFIFYEIKPDAVLPMTFAFKSPAGGKGLLQFLGFTENKKGTRIRYKLLQGTGSVSPMPEKAESPTDSPAEKAEAKQSE